MKKKIEILEPIFHLQHRDPGEDLCKCLTDHVLREWKYKFGEEYMTVDALTTRFEEVDHRFKTLQTEISEHKSKIRHIETNYTAKTQVLDLLKNYAEKDNVQTITDQMKTFPTNAGLEVRFN